MYCRQALIIEFMLTRLREANRRFRGMKKITFFDGFGSYYGLLLLSRVLKIRETFGNKALISHQYTHETSPERDLLWELLKSTP